MEGQHHLVTPNPALQPTGTPSAFLPSMRDAHFGAAELSRWVWPAELADHAPKASPR